jgi:hypothetical protein
LFSCLVKKYGTGRPSSFAPKHATENSNLVQYKKNFHMKTKLFLLTGIRHLKPFIMKKSVVCAALIAVILCFNVPLSAQIQTVSVTGGSIEGSMKDGIGACNKAICFSGYSLRRLFTGFINAAFTAW